MKATAVQGTVCLWMYTQNLLACEEVNFQNNNVTARDILFVYSMLSGWTVMYSWLPGELRTSS